jgi:hypothetical protein
MAAAPHERRIDVMRQKRGAHAAIIAQAKARGELGARLASTATGDVAAAGGWEDAMAEQQQLDVLGGEAGGGDWAEGEGGSDDEQRGAAGSGSDDEEGQRRQANGGSSRKRKFVLDTQPQQG